MIENSQTSNKSFQDFYSVTQPLVRNISGKPLCMIHNGNIKIINKFIQQTNDGFSDFYNISCTSDYKTDSSLLDFIEINIKKGIAMPIILRNIVENIDGAYNLIFYYNDKIFIVRDSLGMRPLSIAKKIKCIVYLQNHHCTKILILFFKERLNQERF